MESDVILKSLSDVEIVNDNLSSVIRSKITARSRDKLFDAFFVGDLGDIVEKYSTWCDLLPRVEPYYAVKVHDDIEILAVLAQLGAGFDCASKREIEMVVGLGVPGNKIIYANPCKQTSFVEFAQKHDVNLMTFDNELELHKVKAVNPEAKMVLRIRPPVSDASLWPLDVKFGCPPDNLSRLLRVAKQIGVDVIGLSFHVGSNCVDATAYVATIAYSRAVFDTAEQDGFHLQLLDIGGGFSGKESAKLPFEQLASILRPTLDKYFPTSMGVRIIAEPGRYFVASAFTLAVSVIARRDPLNNNYIISDRTNTDDEKKMKRVEDEQYMYYINDGLYGYLHCAIFKSEVPLDWSVAEQEKYSDEPRFNSIVWGPTCDDFDCVLRDVQLPLLNIGDWMLIKNIGAYSKTCSTDFNAMQAPTHHYIIDEVNWIQLQGKTHHKMEPEFTHNSVKIMSSDGTRKPSSTSL